MIALLGLLKKHISLSKWIILAAVASCSALYMLSGIGILPNHKIRSWIVNQIPWGGKLFAHFKSRPVPAFTNV